MRRLPWVLIAIVVPGLIAGQDAPVRPAIVGLDHVAFRVADVDGARRFYGDLLGFGVVAPRTAGEPLIVRINARQNILLETGLEPGTDERLSHVALATPDLAAMQAWLTSKQVASTGPERQGCERHGLRVQTPDGQVLEFVEEDAIVGSPSSASPRAISSRLLHAGLVVKDEAAAHGLFRDILGFGEFWRGGRSEARVDWVNMRVPDGTDYLEDMLQDAQPDRRQRGVLHHACLLVPDIQAAWEAVRARTNPADRDKLQRPQVGRNRRWQLNLYDPEGTRVELMEPATATR